MVTLTGDDDQIRRKLLRWSGHESLWDDNDLDGEYSTLYDLLFVCEHVDVEKREFDADRPMASCNFYKVRIVEKQRAKDEIEQIVLDLASKKKR